MNYFHRMVGHFYALYLLAETRALNVALNKEALYCGVTPVSEKLLDGDTDVRNSVILDKQCPDSLYSFLIIDLKGLYTVEYVIVFQGTVYDANQLKRFRVFLGETLEPVNLCSEYPFLMQEKKQVLRINCRPGGNFSSKVKLASRYNRGLDIAEIEVHTLGLPSVKHVLIHRGCYEIFGTEVNVLGLLDCQKKCLRNGFVFAGIKAKEFCSCDNNINASVELPLSTCNRKCEDGVRFCGGQESYSVYIVMPPLPWFRGCYITSADFINKASITGSMTVAKCLHRCNDYKFAKLQGGNYCICDDDEPSEAYMSVDALRSCEKQCTGETSATCGGSTDMAVYSTCKQDANNYINCSQLFQCSAESSYDMFGVCAGCKLDYIGEYCFERAFVEIPETSTVPQNESTTQEPDDLFLLILILKLKAAVPFVLPWLSLILLGFLIYFSSRKSSDNKNSPSSPQSKVTTSKTETAARPQRRATLLSYLTLDPSIN